MLSCAPTALLARSWASPLRISFPCESAPAEMSGRVTPSVPDSPQQRSLLSTLSPTKGAHGLHRVALLHGVVAGLVVQVAASHGAAGSVMPFSSRYS